MRAPASAAAADERFEDRGVGGLARRDVADRDADAARAGHGRAGDAGKSRFGLDEQVVGLALMVGRAGREAADVADDETRKALAQARAADAEAVGCARRKVLDEDVGLGKHA